jgi:hypothetical protein
MEYNNELDAPDASELREDEKYFNEMKCMTDEKRKALKEAVYDALETGFGFDFVNQCVSDTLNEFVENNPNDSTVKKSHSHIINKHELAKFLADAESKKTCSEVAAELYNTKNKDFCVGLILHLTMHVSGSYN